MKKFHLLPFLFLLSFIGESHTQKLPKTLHKYLAAHNAHKIDKAISYYGDDIVFNLVGVWVKNGIDEVRQLEEWDSALNSSLNIEVVEIKGDSVICKVFESNDWFKAIGIEILEHDPVVFILKDKKISKIIAYPSPEVSEKVGKVMSELGVWSMENNDRTMQSLLPGGEFVYSAEAAKKWMLLFKRWKLE